MPQSCGASALAQASEDASVGSLTSQVTTQPIAAEAAQSPLGTSIFRPLGDVIRGVSPVAVSSLVLAALVITVRTARHGLAVLLGVGSCGPDVLGAAHVQGSRDAMHKRVEAQAGYFLGVRTSTFLAFEETFTGHALRCYACPLEHNDFDALALNAAFVTSHAELKEASRIADTHEDTLILAPLTVLHELECKRHCLLAASAVDTMRKRWFAGEREEWSPASEKVAQG